MARAMLRTKTAVVFAATGAIGGAVARQFASEGAHVIASGRRADALEELARDVSRAGGSVDVELVDACDERAVDEHLARVTRHAGAPDVVFNAIGIRVAEGHYGSFCADLPYDAFLLPIVRHAGSQFLTARAAARSMCAARKGLILLLSASIAEEARPFMTGISTACAAVEGLTRSLAADVAPFGVRVLCLRPGAIFETRTIRETMAANSAASGIPLDKFGALIRDSALLRRTPTLEEVARVAAILASDDAGCMTGQVVNASCGLVLH